MRLGGPCHRFQCLGCPLLSWVFPHPKQHMTHATKNRLDAVLPPVPSPYTGTRAMHALARGRAKNLSRVGLQTQACKDKRGFVKCEGVSSFARTSQQNMTSQASMLRDSSTWFGGQKLPMGGVPRENPQIATTDDTSQHVLLVVFPWVVVKTMVSTRASFCVAMPGFGFTLSRTPRLQTTMQLYSM